MKNFKITQNEIDANNVKSAADLLKGEPKDNKNIFDRLPELIAAHFNGFVDAVISKFTDYYNKNEVDTKVGAKADANNVYSKSETFSRTETEQKINEKVLEVGAGDMTKAVYDKNNTGVVDNAEKLGGQLPNYYATASEVETVQTTANNAAAAASKAQSTADNAMPKTGGTFTGAANFEASTYMKNGVFYNGYDSFNTACALLGLTSGNHLQIGSDNYPHPGNTSVKSPKGRVVLQSGNQNMYFCVAGASYTDSDMGVLRFIKEADGSESYLRCQQSDVANLGSSNNKWKNVYATNGQIQTSDRNLKKNIKDIDDRYIQLFDMVKPVSYQLIKGDRIHTGFIAQEVEDAMRAVGLTAEELGFFCKDIKVVQDPNNPEKDIPVLDEYGTPVYIYSLRYEEYIAIMAEKIRRLDNKIKLLETSFNKLLKGE